MESGLHLYLRTRLDSSICQGYPGECMVAIQSAHSLLLQCPVWCNCLQRLTLAKYSGADIIIQDFSTPQCSENGIRAFGCFMRYCSRIVLPFDDPQTDQEDL